MLQLVYTKLNYLTSVISYWNNTTNNLLSGINYAKIGLIDISNQYKELF